MGYGQDLCPNAEEFFYRREINLPMHPRLTDDEIEAIDPGHPQRRGEGAEISLAREAEPGSALTRPADPFTEGPMIS